MCPIFYETRSSSLHNTYVSNGHVSSPSYFINLKSNHHKSLPCLKLHKNVHQKCRSDRIMLFHLRKKDNIQLMFLPPLLNYLIDSDHRSCVDDINNLNQPWQFMARSEESKSVVSLDFVKGRDLSVDCLIHNSDTFLAPSIDWHYLFLVTFKI